MMGSLLSEMRYRCEYLHVPTSSRIIFTVRVPINEDRMNLWNSAYEAMAKRYAARWIEQTGIGVDCVPLGVVRVTDKMSVFVPPVVPVPPVPRHRFSCRMGVSPCGTDSCWYA